MKAVLLAGGLGTRMREETEFRPKPMVEIGGRPVLWHIMKILSAQGINEFIICAGYKAEQIKNYFLNYEANSLDFSVHLGGQHEVKYFGTNQESDWTVTVVDTGLNTPTGGRLKQIEELLEGEDFFCTYGDGIANVDINSLIANHNVRGTIASMTVSQATSRFGVVDLEPNGAVLNFREKPKLADWINIGYFIFSSEIFKYLNSAEMLEDGPLHKIAQLKELTAFKHDGFWQPMDTQRELQSLNQLWESGRAPWKIW